MTASFSGLFISVFTFFSHVIFTDFSLTFCFDMSVHKIISIVLSSLKLKILLFFRTIIRIKAINNKYPNKTELITTLIC